MDSRLHGNNGGCARLHTLSCALFHSWIALAALPTQAEMALKENGRTERRKADYGNDASGSFKDVASALRKCDRFPG